MDIEKPNASEGIINTMHQNTRLDSPTGWIIFYVILIVIGQQLLGIGGVIGAMFTANGLKKVLKNQEYSTNKKVLYSTLYSLGGIAIAFIIALVVFFILEHYFPTISQK